MKLWKTGNKTMKLDEIFKSICHRKDAKQFCDIISLIVVIVLVNDVHNLALKGHKGFLTCL